MGYELEGWHIGESLKFTIIEQGAVASKTMGVALMDSTKFFPKGFEGQAVLNEPEGDGGTGSPRGGKLKPGASITVSIQPIRPKQSALDKALDCSSDSDDPTTSAGRR